MKRDEYLQKKIMPYNPTAVTTVEDAFMALQNCSFQGRNLGRALEVLTNMVKEPNCCRVLCFAGAMTAAGMEEIVCQAIERGVINVVVSTGANIIHSIVNSFSPDYQAHYIGSQYSNDHELFEHKINRVYDTYIPEADYRFAEGEILKLLQKIYDPSLQHIVPSSQLYRKIGENMNPGRSFLYVAAKHNVPIFCGASSDTELALDLIKFRKYNQLNVVLDDLADIEIFAKIIRQYKSHGTIILGGGVPRNWAQQIFPYIDQSKAPGEENPFHGYAYSVRFHSATAQDGGLSGCTISESISWGKYSSDAKNQSVWGDSTVYFPLIMTALFQRMARLGIKSEQKP
jgi:deoxyhypusine synthase